MRGWVLVLFGFVFWDGFWFCVLFGFVFFSAPRLCLRDIDPAICYGQVYGEEGDKSGVLGVLVQGFGIL